MSTAFKQRASLFLTLSTFGASGALWSGCNWTEFNDYEKGAPIRVHDAPKNYRTPGFGASLTAFHTTHSGGPRSIAVVSAGRDAPVVFQRLWNGKRLTEDSFTRCKNKKDCEDGVGVGATLIAIPHWALGTQQQQDGCVLSPGNGKAYVFCDSDTNANQSFDLDLGDLVEAGNSADFSGVGLPASHPLGVALFGAYQVSTRTRALSRGRVFYQPDFQPPGARSETDEVPLPEPLPLRDPLTGDLFANDPDAGDLGFAIAAATNVDNTLWIVVGQPSRGRVIVAQYDRSLPGSLDNKLSTVACLNQPTGDGSFGSSLAIADVDGDGQPEIAVGSAAPNSSERVWLYSGDGLPAPMAEPASCPGWARAPLEVVCSDDVRDVRCADSAFGATLAFGDVNGDGANDLLVGAPYADVDGTREAGAVWLFAGNAGPRGGLLDVDGATTLHADNKARAHLGASLATLHTRGRDEPIAGAPGEDRVFTFMCSELEEDVSGSSLCLPK